ncbi:hypothetical protein M3A96_02390 [Helcobacillus massiliensis]|uniref:Uncharacterized protein n=1 Tax=Helcobacillus massiliensis TaxID=521392 RepID=A0A839QRN9_9MICO|nr:MULTISPECIES: HGxxPAAW family protein [Helcobacillus]MBB3022338.1 hypothetical protein [Helcobacillus massiliensis]MCG7426442.1 hypothetical protein [Helcobacillus sp. ACRRO]MCT1556977.1 hypothetical protein [Helcobacillus massiliensis]MCT2035366.1 hypothetical protein [Helcobacillus massiliensis]MCT2331419.1 hypothetical protein [Helcobacillus massiliensis]
MSKTYMVPPSPPANEGKTLAAWVLSVLVVVGAIVAAFGLATASQLVMIIGAAVIVVGLIAGFGLAKAGKGQPREHTA